MKLSLGKFALDQHDLPTMLENVGVILRFVTINIDQKFTKRIPLIYYFIVFFAGASYIYIYVFSMLWFVFVRCRETGDFTAAAVVFSIGTNSSTCGTKLLFMVIYKNSVQTLVQRFLECDSKVETGSRLSKNILKRLRLVKRRSILVWSSMMTLAVSYVLLPIVILPGRHFTADVYVIYGLEPMVETPNYEIATITMTVTVLTGVYIVAGVTAFILVIIGYIESQILALSDEMLALWEDAEKHYEDNVGMLQDDSLVNDENLKIEIMNKYINNRLKEIIAFHMMDINLLNDFEAKFRITMAIEFVLIILGIISQLLGGLEHTGLELTYTFLQIFMDCYIGQKLIDASNVFESAVYDCKWENFNKENMKVVLFMLQNSQKSLTLTAGGLTKLDFVCLIVNKYLPGLNMKLQEMWATLRSFGLNDVKFPTLIGNGGLLLRTMTINITNMISKV